MIKKPNLILIGPPGSGKGTFTQELKQFHYKSISTGNILRENLTSNSPLAQKCKDFINAGKLVPDELIFVLIHEKIKQALQDKNPLVLDGFPQSITQYAYLLRLLEEENVNRKWCFLEFIIDDKKAIERMIFRLFCPQCHQIYNKLTCPPSKADTCDKCGCGLARRSTDNKEDAIRRLEVYKKETKPILPLAKENFDVFKFDIKSNINIHLYINFVLHMICPSGNKLEKYYEKI